MGVLKELKELVRDMGGNASNAHTASQAIDKIPASGGAGGGGLKLNLIYDESNSGSFRVDKTAKEIADAFIEHGNVWWLMTEDVGHGWSGLDKVIIYASSTNGTAYEFDGRPIYTTPGMETTYELIAASANDYPTYIPEE